MSTEIPSDILALIESGKLSGEFAVSIDTNTVLCCVDGQYYLVKGCAEDAALQHLKAELAVVDTEVQIE